MLGLVRLDDADQRPASQAYPFFTMLRQSPAWHRRTWLLDVWTIACAGLGGARRDRTDDLLLAKQALSQLSYGPVSTLRPHSRRRSRERSSHLELVGLERLELSTSRLSSARSNQLSYRPGKRGGRPNEERETKAAASRKVGPWQAPCVSKHREREEP